MRIRSRRRADRRPGWPRDGGRGRRPHDRLLGGRFELESQVDDFQAGRRGAFRSQVCRRGPGRAAEQFELPGLHGAASRASSSTKAWAICLFSSTAPAFQTDWLLSRDVTSRTYSFYYPRTRPGSNRSLIVSSTNANYRDWADLSPEDYEASKRDLVETTIDGPGEIHSQHPRHSRPCRSLDAAHLPPLHAARPGGQLRHQVRGAGRQPGIARADRPACFMPAAWASSCRAGWGR